MIGIRSLIVVLAIGLSFLVFSHAVVPHDHPHDHVGAPVLSQAHMSEKFLLLILFLAPLIIFATPVIAAHLLVFHTRQIFFFLQSNALLSSRLYSHETLALSQGILHPKTH